MADIAATDHGTVHLVDEAGATGINPGPSDRGEFLWRVAERFGVPCAILTAVMTFFGSVMWYGGGWCGREIVKPVVDKALQVGDKHMLFLESTIESQKANTKTQEALKDGQDRMEKQISEGQIEQRGAVIQNQKAILKNQDTLDAMLRVMPKTPIAPAPPGAN